MIDRYAVERLGRWMRDEEEEKTSRETRKPIVTGVGALHSVALRARETE